MLYLHMNFKLCSIKHEKRKFLKIDNVSIKQAPET